MPNDKRLVNTLARAIAGRPIQKAVFLDTAISLFGDRRRWMERLAERMEAGFHGQPAPTSSQLEVFLRADGGLRSAIRRFGLRVRGPLLIAEAMRPRGVAENWEVQPLADCGELADWLGVRHGQLLWFADRRGWELDAEDRLRNYHYRAIRKRCGGWRLIEAPKSRLKSLQRKLLNGVLNQVPPHPAAHGFVAGRSTRSHAAPHLGKSAVLRLDLRDFFTSIRAARVRGVFRVLGYPVGVAQILAALCLNVTPANVRPAARSASSPPAGSPPDDWRRFARPHLPQGAPTSPALANLCARRLDVRLTALAAAAGACYTRYADDLAFSGQAEFARSAERFAVHVSATVMEEGFQPNFRKTRLMRRGARQQLAGIVVNQKLNAPRADYEALKAVLHNCVRHGPASQNLAEIEDFRAHLLGRIAYVAALNERRGSKLNATFDRIRW